MGVSKNNGTPKSSHFNRVFHDFHHPFWGPTTIFGLTPIYLHRKPGSTISTLLPGRINPKDCQVLSLGDTGFLQFFRVVSRDYGKPRKLMNVSQILNDEPRTLSFFILHFS